MSLLEEGGGNVEMMRKKFNVNIYWRMAKSFFIWRTRIHVFVACAPSHTHTTSSMRVRFSESAFKPVAKLISIINRPSQPFTL